MKAVSQGIMLLSIPMAFSVYTDETETKGRSLSVKKCFQKVSVLCTDKSFVWKVFDMYKENVYVHKECWFEYTQVKWK